MIGGTLGTYTLQRELGRGGMGAVYIGAHALLGRQAAVKVLLPELSRNQALVQRFFNEARAATAIKHPGIVEIYDFGYAADGSAYIVMELLRGETLAARLARVGRLPAAVAVQIARQTAAALGAAHQAGIVHRDLKPDNIYLVPDGETALGERVKLLDFGIAKLADGGPAALSRTSAGTVMGTPYYMAPEQCLGLPGLDHRADLYALGCVLHEMVAGRPPFIGDVMSAVLAAHIQQPPAPLRPVVPDLPAEVEALVFHLLAKAPPQRPASADVVVSALAAIGQRLGVSPSAQLAAVSGASTTWPGTQGGASFTTLGGAAAQGAITSRTGIRASRRWLGLAVAIASVLVIAMGVSLFVVGGDVATTGPASAPAIVAAAEPAPPDDVVVPAGLSPQAAATLRKLREANTGLAECDASLRTYARLAICDGAAETSLQIDVGEKLHRYRQLARRDATDRARVAAVESCRARTTALEHQLRERRCSP